MTRMSRASLLLWLLYAAALFVCCIITNVHGWRRQVTFSPGALQPGPLRGHSAVHYQNQLVVFGGRRMVLSQRENLINETLNTARRNESCYELNFCSQGGTCLENVNADLVVLGHYCLCADNYDGLQCELEEIDRYHKDLWFWSEPDQKTDLSGTGSWRVETPATPTTPWPVERFYHTAVVINDTMLVYGGYSQLCEDYCPGVWQYNFTRHDWRELNVINEASFPARWLHSATVYAGRMYVYMGHRQSTFLNDMFVLVPDDDTDPTSINYHMEQVIYNGNRRPYPTARLGHASASVGRRMYLWGGYTVPDVARAADYSNKRTPGTAFFLVDLWRFDFPTGNWTLLQPTGVVPTEFKSGAATMAGNVMAVYGGYENNQYFDHLWRFNTSSELWALHKVHFTTTNRPTKRADATLTYFPNSQKLYLFAGWGSEASGTTTVSDAYLNDLWEFDLLSCPGDCNKRGVCEFGYCFCFPGFHGSDCQENLCPQDTCEYDEATRVQVCSHCSNHGLCYFGSCRCDPGWEGPECAYPVCLNDCIQPSQGSCALNADGLPVCTCVAPFFGADCSKVSCKDDCSGHGVCTSVNGTCACNTDDAGTWSGEACSVFVVGSAARLRGLGESSWTLRRLAVLVVLPLLVHVWASV